MCVYIYIIYIYEQSKEYLSGQLSSEPQTMDYKF